MHDTCEMCGNTIRRDIYFVTTTDTAPTWLGVCGCKVRKWRWRSAEGEPPWELIGAAD